MKLTNRSAPSNPGSPSLKALRDYYLARAGDPGQAAQDRDLWRQLAHELTVRLNEDGDGKDVPLW